MSKPVTCQPSAARKSELRPCPMPMSSAVPGLRPFTASARNLLNWCSLPSRLAYRSFQTWSADFFGACPSASNGAHTRIATIDRIIRFSSRREPTRFSGALEIRAHAGRALPGLVDDYAVREDEGALAPLRRGGRADGHARADADPGAAAAADPHAADAEADTRARLCDRDGL